MNETQTIATKNTADSAKMLRAMVGIGVLCALFIVLTYEGTLPIIEKNRAEALEKAIFKVLPGIAKTEAYQLNQNGTFVPFDEQVSSDLVVYSGFDEANKLVGIAIEASGQGYADIIRILYGYDPEQQQIIGFYVLESKETPGLGDKIEKDPKFLANFEALDVALTADFSTLKNAVVPVKSGEKQEAWEVDGITGATISSRAIGNIIGASTARWLPIIYKNKDAFIVQENNAATAN
jgi:electron transport complex protein RnfG